MNIWVKLLIVGALSIVSFPLSAMHVVTAIISIATAVTALVIASKFEKGVNIGLRILTAIFNVISIFSIVRAVLLLGTSLPLILSAF